MTHRLIDNLAGLQDGTRNSAVRYKDARQRMCAPGRL